MTLKNQVQSVPGHSVVLTGVTQRTLQRVNGSLITRFGFTAMNPWTGTVGNYSANEIMSAGRYFLIKP